MVNLGTYDIMARFERVCLVLLALVTVESINGQFQAYTVQDIADMQNEVLYETFDYFYFSQERQLQQVFQRVADLESRMIRVMQALGIYREGRPTDAPAVQEIDAPVAPTVPVSRTRQPPVRPRQPNRNPLNMATDPPRPETPPPRRRPVRPSRRPPIRRTKPTTRPTTAPTTAPTTIATTTPAPTQPPNPATCNEIFERGMWTASQTTYSIDPLRKNKFFNVQCEQVVQGDGSVKMFTLVNHSKMERLKVRGFEAPGEFSLGPVYNASSKQLRALTEASETCSQFIEYRCRGAVLMSRARSGETYGFWEDINGDRVESWGGAPANSGMCACGVDGSCQGGGMCNCDSNPKAFLTDSGDITEKELLPVTDVRLGDTGGKKETGNLLLGPLRCEG
ncbi:neurexin like receptor 1-like [Diadema antillarum]|uniref:neurexin like receptor 1-like n=1 Tax=Diadema antillarum TaxID=105358 RepID=UPI003A88C8FF